MENTLEINEPSKQLWHDMNSNKYFLIENKNGTQRQVNRNGDYIKKFNLQITGKAKYQERIKKAQGDASLMPFQPESLEQFPEFYIPQPDKFDGYAQVPRTKVPSYYNQRPQTSSNSRMTSMSHITGTAKDYLQATQTKKIIILEERHFTANQEFKQVENSVKIINGRPISTPNLTNYRNFRVKASSMAKQSPIKPENSKSPNKSFQETNTQEQKKINFQTTDPLLKSAIKLDQLIGNQINLSVIKTKINSFTINTLDKNSITVVSQPQNSYITLKNKQNFLKDLEKEKVEIQAFSLPIKVEKRILQTKGRFNQKIPTNLNLYEQTRDQMKLLYPNLFIDTKDNPKKIELEKQRRFLNKLKEKDMLEKNLKNMC